MKFNVITGLWTLAIMLMSFNIAIIFIDYSFSMSILYKLSVLINGFILGTVVNEWSQ
jgi:hypothetical protein